MLKRFPKKLGLPSAKWLMSQHFGMSNEARFWLEKTAEDTEKAEQLRRKEDIASGLLNPEGDMDLNSPGHGGRLARLARDLGLDKYIPGLNSNQNRDTASPFSGSPFNDIKNKKWQNLSQDDR